MSFNSCYKRNERTNDLWRVLLLLTVAPNLKSVRAKGWLSITYSVISKSTGHNGPNSQAFITHRLISVCPLVPSFSLIRFACGNYSWVERKPQERMKKFGLNTAVSVLMAHQQGVHGDEREWDLITALWLNTLLKGGRVVSKRQKEPDKNTENQGRNRDGGQLMTDEQQN